MSGFEIRAAVAEDAASNFSPDLPGASAMIVALVQVENVYVMPQICLLSLV